MDWEDPLEKEMATNFSTLAWKTPWTEKPGGLQSKGHKELDTTEWAQYLCNHGIRKFMKCYLKMNFQKYVHGNVALNLSEVPWYPLNCVL